jgi:hypothetical protein
MVCMYVVYRKRERERERESKEILGRYIGLTTRRKEKGREDREDREGKGQSSNRK